MAKIGRKMRRGLLLAGFYGTLLLLIGVVLSSYIQTGNRSQLSAYDDDWNDLSAFREDINDMGVTTRSVVSSPLLLNDIDDPGNALENQDSLNLRKPMDTALLKLKP
jgi:hypothetical protein